MPNKLMTVAASAFLTMALVLPASAQGATFDLSTLTTASAGSQGNTTYKTGATARGLSRPGTAPPTTNQRIARWRIPIVSQKLLTPVFGIVGYQSLVNPQNFNPLDNVDNPNKFDSWNNYFDSQAIKAQEAANEAQDDADAANTAAQDNSKGTAGMGSSDGSGDAAGF